MKLTNFEKKKMIPLTDKKYESYLNQTNCHICKKQLEGKYKIKNHRNVKDHCHFTGAAHSICDLKYSIPEEIPVVFHNELNYDYLKRASKTV